MSLRNPFISEKTSRTSASWKRFLVLLAGPRLLLLWLLLPEPREIECDLVDAANEGLMIRTVLLWNSGT